MDEVLFQTSPEIQKNINDSLSDNLKSRDASASKNRPEE